MAHIFRTDSSLTVFPRRCQRIISAYVHACLVLRISRVGHIGQTYILRQTSSVSNLLASPCLWISYDHGVGRRGDSTRRASAAKLGSARTYALVGGATRTRAMHCGFSVATGMETRLVLRRIERALGFQWHEFMVASNENTLSKEQRFLGTSRVSMWILRPKRMHAIWGATATVASTLLCEDAATSASNLNSSMGKKMLRCTSAIHYGHGDYGIRRQFEFRWTRAHMNQISILVLRCYFLQRVFTSLISFFEHIHVYCTVLHKNVPNKKYWGNHTPSNSKLYLGRLCPSNTKLCLGRFQIFQLLIHKHNKPAAVFANYTNKSGRKRAARYNTCLP